MNLNNLDRSELGILRGVLAVMIGTSRCPEAEIMQMQVLHDKIHGAIVLDNCGESEPVDVYRRLDELERDTSHLQNVVARLDGSLDKNWVEFDLRTRRRIGSLELTLEAMKKALSKAL